MKFNKLILLYSSRLCKFTLKLLFLIVYKELVLITPSFGQDKRKGPLIFYCQIEFIFDFDVDLNKFKAKCTQLHNGLMVKINFIPIKAKQDVFALKHSE